MSIDFEALREANVSRQTEWVGNDKAGVDFRALEVADEAGEVAGAVKKWFRAQRGICGSVASIEDIADEIGDTIISLDLLAIELRLDVLCPSDADYWFDRPAIEIVLRLDKVIGDQSGGVLRHIRNLTVFEDADPRIEDIHIHMQDAVALLESLALAVGIDVGQAVAAKFNKTSEKYGLKTRILVE